VGILVWFLILEGMVSVFLIMEVLKHNFPKECYPYPFTLTYNVFFGGAGV
jgi:hypothetical protein